MVRYLRPATLEDALTALQEAGDNGRVLVGGTDLLVDVRRNPLSPSVLVDVKAVSDLPAALVVTNDAVRIGPTATMSNIVADATMQQWFPALVASANVVGSVAIRNRATLVGNICNASPAGDTAPALLIYGARVTIRGTAGDRTVPIGEFFTGPGQTSCATGEIVTMVEIPRPPGGQRSAFQRLTRRRGVDLATVNVAASVDSDSNVSVGLGAVAPTPVFAQSSKSVDLTDNAAVRALAEELTEVASPISDVRASEAYRREMVTVLTVRAIQDAVNNEKAGVS